MYIETKVNGRTHRHTFDEPQHLPEPGDIYSALIPFITAGKVAYDVGDELLIICRTDDAPHGRITSHGNLLVEGVDKKITIWTNIELAVTEGMLGFKRTIFETVA